MHRRRCRRRVAFACATLVSLGLLGSVGHAQAPFPTGLKTVAGVRLEGRRKVPASDIWAVLKTKRPSRLPWRSRPVVRLDFLNVDTRNIERVCQRHGYLDARVDYRLGAAKDPSSVLVTFVIHEGERSHVSTIDFENMKALQHETIRKRLYLKPGKPFNPLGLVVDTARISSAYKERGMLPHVTFSAMRDSMEVAVRYTVDEGPVYRVGTVHLPPQDSLPVKEELIRRELLLKPNDIYRASRVQHSVERLYETELFNQVAIVPYPDSTNTHVDFDVRLRARHFRWIDAGVGSGTQERFRFTGEWGNRNLFGQGYQGAVAARLAFDHEARFLVAHFSARILDLWLLKSRTAGSITISHEERRDYANPAWVVSQRPEGVRFQIRRDLGRYARIALTQDNLFVNQDFEVVDPTQVTPDTLTSRYYTTHLLQLAAHRDTRDHLLLATRGSSQAVAVQLAGGPLRGTSSFLKGDLVLSWYTPFRGNWLFATRLRGGAIDPFGEAPEFTPDAGVDEQVARVPLEDRFRIGGVNSLRGYNENTITPTGGLAVIQGNAEVRIPLAGPFGLEVFLDAGNVWARPKYIKGEDFIPRITEDPMDPTDVRYVFGAGLRLNLPIGPVRVDFTWSPRPDENGRWLVAEPQFAIGPSF